VPIFLLNQVLRNSVGDGTEMRNLISHGARSAGPSYKIELAG